MKIAGLIHITINWDFIIKNLMVIKVVGFDLVTWCTQQLISDKKHRSGRVEMWKSCVLADIFEKSMDGLVSLMWQEAKLLLCSCINHVERFESTESLVCVDSKGIGGVNAKCCAGRCY